MADIQNIMRQVDKIVSSLLGPVDTQTSRLPQTLELQKQWLLNLGFSDESVTETWPNLAQATALSYKTDRDERARQELLFRFIGEIAQHKLLDRDLGLKLLLDFMRATRGKATFFAMLLRSPRLIQDLARLFCVSPYLGSILTTRPELLDHFILQVDDDWSTDPQTQLEQMAERKLLTEIWSANQFLVDQDLPAMFQRITNTADDIAAQLNRQLMQEFPSARFEVLALGKWGGRELGLASDLDFIFVTPGAPGEHDSKAARRFISRLTDPLKGGRLYEIDLRLRPSGQSGPLLVSRDQLLTYWRDTAQPWERQAYLRSRSLARTPFDFGLLFHRPLSSADLEELKQIRQKLLQPMAADSMDLKFAPGGLIDIEFCVQTAVLHLHAPMQAEETQSTCAMIDRLSTIHKEWQTHADELKRIYLEIRRYEQVLRLTSTHRVKSIYLHQAGFLSACRLLGSEPTKTWNIWSETLTRSRALLNQLDPTGLKI